MQRESEQLRQQLRQQQQQQRGGGLAGGDAAWSGRGATPAATPGTVRGVGSTSFAEGGLAGIGMTPSPAIGQHHSLAYARSTTSSGAGGVVMSEAQLQSALAQSRLMAIASENSLKAQRSQLQMQLDMAAQREALLEAR